jgi:hypothetical protein
MNTQKTYKIFDYPQEGMVYGEFKGKYPGQAAKKIFTKLAHEQSFTNSNNKKALVFSIMNMKDKKELKYIGTRIKLMEPINLTLKSGRKITFRYKNIVTKYKEYYNH